MEQKVPHKQIIEKSGNFRIKTGNRVCSKQTYYNNKNQRQCCYDNRINKIGTHVCFLESRYIVVEVHLLRQSPRIIIEFITRLEGGVNRQIIGNRTMME